MNHSRITLASRPVGAPTSDNFRLESGVLPQPGKGEVLLRTVYLSLDPYMRGRMSDADSYAEPIQIGETIVGGTVSRVELSNNPDFNVGDWVLSYSGWQTHSISNGVGLHKLDERTPPSLALGVLGMPGFTAYMGLLEIGKPKIGETVVVAGATGAVGSVVGQIAKRQGCRVIGIAGGAEKCRYAVEQFGFDDCIDHRSSSFNAELAKACPNGIDVYFENVGGQVFDAVLPLLNTGARIPLCGLITQYNSIGLPDGPNRLPLLMRTLLTKRIHLQGFIIFDDYGHRYPEFLKIMGSWVLNGDITYREDIITGIENAPQAFIGLLNGNNFGKLIIQVSAH